MFKIRFDLFIALSLLPTVLSAINWNSAGAADWGTPGSWSPATVPNGIGQNATFPNLAGSFHPVTVNLVAPTVTFITFNSIDDYLFSGANTISLDGGGLINVSSSGTATFDVPIDLLTPTQINMSSTSSLVMNSPISGSNLNCTLSGSNELTLGAANTFSNITINLLSSSSVVASGNNSLSSGSLTLTTTFTSVLDLDSSIQSIGDFSGSGEIDSLPGASFTTTGTFNSTFSGRINGSVVFIKAGSNTLTLSGVNTYTGGTQFNGGSISISTSSGVGSTASPWTFNGGALITSGSFSTTRTITINGSGGTLNIAGVGTVLTINTVAGMTGAGALTKDGSGTLMLSTSNSYSGGTIIQNGFLTLNSGGALHPSGSVNISGASGVFTISGVSAPIITIGDLSGLGEINLGTKTLIFGTATPTVTYSGNIGGVGGSLAKTGSGTAILLGVNSYTGGTTVTDGILQGNTFSLQGNITNNTDVYFDQDFNGSYAGAITSGNVSKYGSGTVNYTGTSSIASYTGVAGGSAINGSLTVSGLTSIQSGASMSGTGTLTAQGGLQLDGEISPGNSTGTLTIIGNATFSPSAEIVIEFNPTTSDLIQITGPGGGDLALNSPTLILSPTPGIYSFPKSYVIIDAVTLSGDRQFGNIINTFPLVSVTVSYDQQDGNVLINLGLSQNPFLSIATEGNARQVAKCLDAFSQNPCGNIQYLINVLSSMTQVEPIIEAMLELQPSQLTSLAIVEEEDLFLLRSKVHEEMNVRRELCTTSKGNLHPWFSAIGGLSVQNNLDKEPGYHAASGGTAAGVDVKLGQNGLFGGCVGYLYNNLNWKDSRGKAFFQNFYAGFYGGYEALGGYLQGSLLGGYTLYKTKRSIVFGFENAIDIAARGSFGGWEGDIGLEAGYPMRVNGWTFTPLVGIDYTSLYQQKFTETGAESLNLTIQGHTADLLTSEGGLDIRYCTTKKTAKIQAFTRVAAIYEQRFYGQGEKASFPCTCTMEVVGLYPSRALAALTFGADLSFGQNELSFSYTGKGGNKVLDQSLFINYTRTF